MRFEIRHPGGIPHEVDIPSTLAVFGRDPSSDVVLNDPKCSRRHAVVELTAEGLVVRDAGSSNGVRVNGSRVERGRISPSDVLRLGDVTVTVLADGREGLVEGASPPVGFYPKTGPVLTRAQGEAAAGEVPEKRAPLPPRPSGQASPPPPPPRPAQKPQPRSTANPSLPRTTQAERERVRRPLFLSALSVLWALSGFGFVAAGIAVPLLGLAPTGLLLALALAGCVLGLILSLAMAAGIWTRATWARWAQVVLGSLGLLNCPFSLSSGLVLFYVLRPAARVQFSVRRRLVDLDRDELALVTNDSSETILTVALLGLTAVGVFASAALGFWIYRTRG